MRLKKSEFHTMNFINEDMKRSSIHITHKWSPGREGKKSDIVCIVTLFCKNLNFYAKLVQQIHAMSFQCSYRCTQIPMIFPTIYFVPIPLLFILMCTYMCCIFAGLIEGKYEGHQLIIWRNLIHNIIDHRLIYLFGLSDFLAFGHFLRDLTK